MIGSATQGSTSLTVERSRTARDRTAYPASYRTPDGPRPTPACDPRLGRSLAGYPLKACEACGKAILWPRQWNSRPRTTAPIPPVAYYARRFCRPACALDQRRAIHKAQMTSRASGLELGPLPLHRPGMTARTLAEITTCRKCRSAALATTEVSKRCLMCGATMFAADGAWDRESRLGIMTSAIERLG